MPRWIPFTCLLPPPYGYDLRYENADGKFLLILRYMPDGSKKVLNEQGKVVRTLARGESLNISKRDHPRLKIISRGTRRGKPKEVIFSRSESEMLWSRQFKLGLGGRKKLAEAIKIQVNFEGEELVAARKRANRQLNKIKKIIGNLLDNITSTNRQLVDQRLRELQQRKEKLEARLEELDRLVVSQAEIKSIAADAMQFLSSLEFTLRECMAQEKLVALRRCIEKISVDKPDGIVGLKVRSVPVGNLEGTEERHISL